MTDANDGRAAQLDFGTLNPLLEQNNPAKNLSSWDEGVKEIRREFGLLDDKLTDDPFIARTQNLLKSSGPIADAYILSTDPVAAINGPIASAKSTATNKRALVSAQRMFPMGGNGYRRYPVSFWADSYKRLWNAVIPSWWKLIHKEFPGSHWVGSPPRAAQHTIIFEDQFGVVEIIAGFQAFSADDTEDDVRGFEFADAVLPEMDTQPEMLIENLQGRVGRDPTPAQMMREGRIYGDFNAPDVGNWTYPLFLEHIEAGGTGRFESTVNKNFVLYRQPGGRELGAENLAAMGPDYYHKRAEINAHRPWWVRRMIDNIPGVTQGTDLVYPAYDDARMRSSVELAVYSERPVIVGIDNELTPAAVYVQEAANGQGRTLAEIALQGQTIESLGRAMLALEATRFVGCEFLDVCDPAMLAGEDAGADSQRKRLEAKIGRKIAPAETNEPDVRRSWVNDKIEGPALPGGAPSYIADPSCKVLRRGKLQRYYYRKIQGTDELGGIAKTFEGHAADAEQYAYSKMGTAAASKRRTKLREDRVKKQREAAALPRYNPITRRKRA